uniref:Uncharacterized protein n=1 Tax=Tanacetum cinerariifolium TaxID=118510 RepID=A0A6L2JQ09_TANCI|nr:hypothetical protein [Tanacetum cinerariifolium]
MTPSTIATITTSRDAPIPPTTIPSIILENLPTFNSAFRFDERLRSLETTFSEYRQTNPFVDAVFAIPGIVHHYMTQQMTEAVQEAVQIQTDRLQDSLQRENDEFLRNIDENMKKIIKGQIKSQNFICYCADLSEMELKKILIEKMEGNKSIQRLDEQRNLYNVLVEAYDADKAILDTYGESTILKRRREDDDQEGPFAGLDRGSTTWSQSRQLSASESAFAEEPVQTTCQVEEPSHLVFETAAQGDAQSWISELARQTDAHSSFNELLDTPIYFSNFIMNRLNVDTLTPALLAGPTYELMRGSCTSLTELEYHLEEVYKETTDQLDWVNPKDYRHIKWIEDLVLRAMLIQEPINYDMPALWGVSHWGRKRQHFYGFAVNQESALDVYSKRRIIAVTELKIVEWHNYKHLDWISRQVEDLQLGVESYQKRLNLTKPDTDGTLNDVHNALDDRLKGIRMQYLPITIWRRGDKDRAAAMI